ncbi:MAG: B12-binding domain-containing radical SAM protein [Candidatus Glassbacteria bacterium]|nr:B12-binding domain-containing radical SAM protein [Candidatus Glassbacteria bacterium]
MTDLILWNSTSTRRRSPTDDFLDNGLAILKTYIEEQGYSVEVIDWANSSQWEAMTPRVLARINGFLVDRLLGPVNGIGRKQRGRKLLGAAFMFSQELTTKMQRRAQKKMIRALARHVSDTGCKIIGIKTWYGESYIAARQFAAELRREVPEALVVAGGPHASTYREAVLEDDAFDFAVVGEGESTLRRMLELAGECESRTELVERIVRDAEAGSLENTVYRVDGGYRISTRRKLNANEKTVPRYGQHPGKTRIHVIVESLGCPWGKCSFCTHSSTYGSYSVRKPQLVVDELEQMVGNGIGLFRYAGSSTTLAHARQIAREIIDRDLKVIYSMFGRAERKASDPARFREVVESYRLLIRSGFRAIFLGAESGDDTVNEVVMNKGIGRADIVGTIRAMREASKLECVPIDIGISLIYPAPTMGRISLDKLKQADIMLVEETKPDSVLVCPPAPFPGSEWFKRRDEFGFQLDDNFVRDMLEYDYVLYKPLFMWPEIGLKLNDMSLKQIFEQCGSLRTELERRGFVTEVTDVQFLMLRAAGFPGVNGVIEFKHRTQHSILSCDYRWINRLQEKVNQASYDQAMKNTSECAYKL